VLSVSWPSLPRGGSLTATATSSRQRIKTLKAIRAKIRPEPVRPPPPNAMNEAV
jgi:hypothetical protein